MKKLIAVLGWTLCLTYPMISQAREVTFTTQLKNYRGDGAYLALYLTDTNGQYQRTLWVAGKKSKYYKHLVDWMRGSNNRPSEYDGLTGASISNGQRLQITVDLDDHFIDNGYQIRVDTAVEDRRDIPADIIVLLTTDGQDKKYNGTGYIESFSYQL